jgi:hypothetical protein
MLLPVEIGGFARARTRPIHSAAFGTEIQRTLRGNEPGSPVVAGSFPAHTGKHAPMRRRNFNAYDTS